MSLFVISLILVSCGGTDDSENIANAFAKEECEREENTFWNGSECFNPCKYNPCGSHGICKATGAETYECICEDNYFSNGSRCQNPCDPNPCGHGSCKSTSAENYKCICDDNYFSNDTKCINPCEDNPCGSYSTCKSTGVETYNCICEDNYFSNGTECVNPCDNNPCDSKSDCIPKGVDTYECECENGLFWNGKDCDSTPPCDERNQTPCWDTTTFYMWSSRSPQNLTWNSANSYCNNLTEGGYSDWKLPTLAYIESFYNTTNLNIDKKSVWWSSDKECKSVEKHFALFFNSSWRVCNSYSDCSGCVYNYDDSTNSVRCVRW